MSTHKWSWSNFSSECFLGLFATMIDSKYQYLCKKETSKSFGNDKIRNICVTDEI